MIIIYPPASECKRVKMNFLKTLKILRIKEKKSFVELTFFQQTLSFAADTSQPVGQKRGAKQVQPCQRCAAEGVGNADEKVCQTEQPHHLSNFVQVGDTGIHILKHIKGT